ncbi:Mini-ribonuclease 3 [Thermanaerosceptrum fracticalcis]|nr:ribonuclease III domain-containing protein [Thermanaerosceptrum fracticalcis]
MWIYPTGNPREMPPLVLAYLGDAVFELYVRLYLVNKGITKTNSLHREAASLVKAASQAHFLQKLDGLLSDEEKDVARRGRNAKSGHVPKNAQVTEYRLSTGFETLLGYLFLLEREERITELLGHLLNEGNS